MRRAWAGSLAIAIGMVPMLQGCASSPPPARLDPTTALYGMSKARLADCAGPAAASSSLDDVEYLVYRTQLKIGGTALADLPTLPLVGSLAVGQPAHDVACEATVVLRRDRVEAVTYRTTPPQNAPEAAAICRPILQSCLAPGDSGPAS